MSDSPDSGPGSRRCNLACPGLRGNEDVGTDGLSSADELGVGFMDLVLASAMLVVDVRCNRRSLTRMLGRSWGG